MVKVSKGVTLSNDNPDDLLQMFQSITTTDHDSLIGQFSKILQIDSQVAHFFLESSNWNVETAVNNYLLTSNNSTNGDLESMMYMNQKIPEATFISDLSESQALVFAPNSVINMVWSFMNTGKDAWPTDAYLTFADGHEFQVKLAEHSHLGNISPGNQIDFSILLQLPDTPGAYAGCWRLSCGSGYFGDPVWVILTVGEGGIVMNTQSENNYMAMETSSTDAQNGNSMDDDMDI